MPLVVEAPGGAGWAGGVAAGALPHSYGPTPAIWHRTDAIMLTQNGRSVNGAPR